MPQGAIPFPFGDCRICLDKATGVHYGVNTCEGCKGFFKRSIPKASKYKCFFGGMCQVNAQNRNRCKACRFQRCVQAGMSLDAVKMGRIPKVDKERALEAKAREGMASNGALAELRNGFMRLDNDSFFHQKPEPQPRPAAFDRQLSTGEDGSGDMDIKPDIEGTSSALKEAMNSVTRHSEPQRRSDLDSFQPSRFDSESRSHPSHPDTYLDRKNDANMTSQLSPPAPSVSAANFDLLHQHENCASSQSRAPPPPLLPYSQEVAPHDFTAPSTSGDDCSSPQQQRALHERQQRHLAGHFVDHRPSSPRSHQPYSQHHHHQTSSFNMATSPVDSHHPHLSPNFPLHTNPDLRISPSHMHSQHLGSNLSGNIPANANGGLEATWGEAVRGLQGGMHGCGSDSGISAEGSDLNHHSPKDPLDQSHNSSASIQRPQVADNSGARKNRDNIMDFTTGIANLREMSSRMAQARLRADSQDSLPAMDNSLIRVNNGELSSPSEFSPRNYQRSFSETHAQINIFPNANDYPNSFSQESNPLRSPGIRSENPTPPKTPDLFSPNIIRELFQQVFIARSRTPSIQSRLQEVLKRVPQEDYQKLVKNFVDEAAKHLSTPSSPHSVPSFTPGAPNDSNAYMPEFQRPLLNNDDMPSAAKRMRTQSMNDLDPAVNIFNNSTQYPTQVFDSQFRIKEENVANDGLYGRNEFGSNNTQHIVDLFSQDAAANVMDIKHEPSTSPRLRTSSDVNSTQNVQDDGPRRQRKISTSRTANSDDDRDKHDNLSMVRSTLLKLKEAELKHFVRVRARLELVRKLDEGILQRHPLNCLTKATYKEVKKVWSALFQSIPASNQFVIGLCKDVPGFNNLGAEDQATLMQAAYFDIWMLSHAVFFNDDSTLALTDTLDDTLLYSRFWMCHFLPENLVNKMLNFGQCLNAMKLSRVQIYILCALQLTDPDGKELLQLNEVQLLNNHYLDVLAQSVRETHALSHHRLLISIFKLLPVLSEINALQSTIIGQFQSSSPPERCERMIVPGSKEEYLREVQQSQSQENNSSVDSLTRLSNAESSHSENVSPADVKSAGINEIRIGSLKGDGPSHDELDLHTIDMSSLSEQTSTSEFPSRSYNDTISDSNSSIMTSPGRHVTSPTGSMTSHSSAQDRLSQSLDSLSSVTQSVANDMTLDRSNNIEIDPASDSRASKTERSKSELDQTVEIGVPKGGKLRALFEESPPALVMEDSPTPSIQVQSHSPM